MSEESKFIVEQVDSVPAPPRAKVEDAETPAEKLERKRDYLEGFLAEKPQGLAAGEPGGAIYEGVIAALRDIFDPEIPVNIVELGLVYSAEVATREDGQRTVDVRMTLTAPACGMGEILVDDVRSKIEMIPTVAEADVELVFDPPWNRSMMSDVARLETGML